MYCKKAEFKTLTKESNVDITKNIIDTIDKFSKDTVFFFPSQQQFMKGIKTLQ